MFPISGFLDMRKLLPGTFQDFMFYIVNSQDFWRNKKRTCPLGIHFFLVGVMVSQQGASVSELPAALRRPQKKARPWILEHVFCWVCDFKVILRSPGKMFIMGPICSNDNASKTRIEILCKKTCCIAHVFLLSLISYEIPGKLEPWPECQLELSLDLGGALKDVFDLKTGFLSMTPAWDPKQGL